MPVRIGELLLKEKRITPEQLQEVLTYQKTNGGKLGVNLVKLGMVTDEEITALLSKQYGVPSINLAQFELDPAVIKLIPADTAQKYQIVPLSRAGGHRSDPALLPLGQKGRGCRERAVGPQHARDRDQGTRGAPAARRHRRR